MLLNSDCVNNKVKEGIKRSLETSENENTATQNLWDTAKAVLRRKLIHSITGQPQETRKLSNKHSNFTLKGTRKKEQWKNPKVSKIKEIMKIRAEIHKRESKKNKTIQKINETKNGSLKRSTSVINL